MGLKQGSSPAGVRHCQQHNDACRPLAPGEPKHFIRTAPRSRLALRLFKVFNGCLSVFTVNLSQECEIVSLSFSLGVSLQTVDRCGDNQRRHTHLVQTALRATMHINMLKVAYCKHCKIVLMMTTQNTWYTWF